MKNHKILIVAVLFFSAAFVNAQTFVEEDKVINLGIGLGTSLYSGAGYNMSIPPISASFEYGLMELGPGILGVGGYIGVSGYKWEYSSLGTTYGWKYNNFIIGARGNYHYGFVENLDTYGGFMLGYNIVTSKATGDWPAEMDLSANTGSFVGAFYVGGRYYFNEKFAAMAELGYGVVYLNIGVAFKL